MNIGQATAGAGAGEFEIRFQFESGENIRQRLAPDDAALADDIFEDMNAVDTGWVTDEDPAELAKRKQEEEDFQPPLDIVDGAARVMDPLFDGINTRKHWCGKFLKDYRPISW